MIGKKQFNNSITRDILSLIIICLVNPVWMTFIYDTTTSYPDSFKYLSEAENIINHFAFNTGPWGHIDESMILPPVYPALTALLMLFGIESFGSALLVSQLSAFIFSFLVYFYLKTGTNRLIAVVTAISIQLTLVYFDYASRVLSESLFMLLVLAMFLVLKHMSFSDIKNTRIISIVLGCMLALIFLTREIGLVFFIAAVCYLVLTTFRSKSYKPGLRTALIFTCAGFFLLTLPYYSLTYLQTGEPPLTRSYRLNEYVVKTSADEISKLAGDTGNQTSTDYADIFKSRREMMQLLPDGSEMLVMVQTENPQQNDNLYHIFLHNIKMYPGVFAKQFIEKLELARGIFGGLVFWVFVFSIFTSLFHKSTLVPGKTRIIIPFFAVLYLLALSVFPANIERYVEILGPFVLIHISMEIFIMAWALLAPGQLTQSLVANIILSVVIGGVIIFSTPGLFYLKRIYPENSQLEQELQKMRSLVQGENVFSQFPMPAFYAGGKFMQLPNDEFEKVTVYSGKTGIKWLLVLDMPEIRDVMKISDKSYSWVLQDLENEHPDKIEFVYGIHDETSKSTWKLYKFKQGI